MRVLTLLIIMVLPALAAGKPHLLKAANDVHCEVVVPTEAGPVALFAGQELQRFLQEAFRADVPLVEAATAERTSLILGRSAALRAAGVDVDALARDGFVIRSAGDDLLIAGRDDLRTHPEQTLTTSQDFLRDEQYERGTLYGVYHFLEKALGCRFYFPGPMGTIVPRHATLSIPAWDVQVTPDHTARHMGFTGALPDGSDGPDAYPFKNLHRLLLRTQTRYIPSCHGLREFDLIRRFGEQHPEYFALMEDGSRYNQATRRHTPQLCFSNAGLRDQIYLDAKAYLEGQAAETRDILFRGRHHGWARTAFQPGYVDIMPQDGFYPCHCDDCQALLKGTRYGDIDPAGASELVWGFVAEIANRLKADGVPGTITCMAYSSYRSVPQVELPDNVMVMVAMRGPWNVAGIEEELALVEAWNRKIGRQVWIWNYIHKGSGLAMPGVPCMTPVAIGRYYSRLAPHIFGAYMSSTSDHYLFQYLNMYVAHKIFWDNQTDVAALLDEHYRLMFGEAASPMAAVYQRLEANWLNKIVANEVETDLGPATIPPSRYDLWERIYSAAEVAELDRLFTQAEAAATGSARERVRFMRDLLFAPLQQARADYAGDQVRIAQFQAEVPERPAGDTILIDGNLRESAWAAATTLHLQPLQPEKAPETSPPASARLLRDSDHLYIAFICDEPLTQQLQAPARERDARGIFRDATVEMFLNPTGDRKHYRQIVINAAGSLTDLAAEKQGAEQVYDWSWDSQVRYAVDRRENRWTVEVAIPLANLGDLNPQGFPANLAYTRVVTGTPATPYTWSPFLIKSFHELDNFGTLSFRPVPTNLIDNPDFAEPLDGRFFGRWYHHPRPGNDARSWTLDRAVYVTAGQSLRLHETKPDSHISIKQALPGLKPSTTYTLSYQLRTDSIKPADRSGGARAAIWDEKNHYYAANPFVGTIPWHEQRFTFTTGPEVNETVTSFISLILFRATGTVWFDHVRLIEQPQSPASHESTAAEGPDPLP